MKQTRLGFFKSSVQSKNCDLAPWFFSRLLIFVRLFLCASDRSLIPLTSPTDEMPSARRPPPLLLLANADTHSVISVLTLSICAVDIPELQEGRPASLRSRC